MKETNMEGKRGLPNTAKMAFERILAEAFLLGASESIMHQEAQGQRDFVASDTLPTRVDGKEGDDATDLLARMGIKVLGPVADDDQFQFVELPEGWKKVATEHPMSSKLLDDKGRERATLFYKAAHYDRHADMSITCRYTYDYFHDEETTRSVLDRATGERLVTFENQTWESKDCVQWLDEHLPEWRDPMAYWDA